MIQTAMFPGWQKVQGHFAVWKILGQSPRYTTCRKSSEENMQEQNVKNEDRDLFYSIEHTGMGFYVVVGILFVVISFALYSYIFQIIGGLGVTGLAQPVSWGFYIVNFVFFIGISHAGTLISAILRLSKAEWRRPITRMAEVITAIVLAIGGLHPILDLGQPGQMWNLATSGVCNHLYYGM